MKFYKLFCFSVGIIVLTSGCSNLAVMKPVKKITSIQDDSSLVNFVRPAVFIGDGIDYEVWDGNNFVGTLAAGTMIQFKTTPGKHLLMFNFKNQGWNYVKANLRAGKSYYIKPNHIPFAGIYLGVAKTSDKRITVWHDSLTPVAVDHKKSEKIPLGSISEAERKVETFNSNNVGTEHEF